MARIDDVAQGYIKVLKQTYPRMTKATRDLIEGAVRYGFEHGESFGKYAKYAGEVQKEIAREVFQETKRQKVVRTLGEYVPVDLQKALDEGWTVAMVNHLDRGYGLEYILERTEIDGRTETVKNPEVVNGKEAERN